MIKVAIIDDDESVRTSIANVLSASGVKTTTFDGASSFLDSARIEDFQALLVDKDMPGMTGREFYELVKSQNHELPKFVLMSGSFSMEDISSSHVSQDPILHAKPFRIGELLMLLETGKRNTN